MAVYIVTGKLGSGKSLLCCWQIQQYLKRRCPVALNFDLCLEHNDFCKPTNNYSRVLRLPDMPSETDLVSIGFGNEQYNEEKFGGVFLDEAGIWLNSRQWSSGGRTDILKFFLYIRKRRWDLWLIVQDLDIVDKQIRSAIAEHVVYCSRSDRFQMPILPKIVLNVLTIGLINFVKIPKFHTAICRYGTGLRSPIADTWYYRGEDFFGVYNTTQEFNKDYSAGIYSLLPPFYIHRLKAYQRKLFLEYWFSLPSLKAPSCRNNKYMRLTKIYFKKFKVISAFLLGVFITFLISFFTYKYFNSPVKNTIISKAVSNEYEELLNNSKLDSIDYLPRSGYRLYLISDSKRFSSEDLIRNKYSIVGVDTLKNEAYIKNSVGRVFTITK